MRDLDRARLAVTILQEYGNADIAGLSDSHLRQRGQGLVDRAFDILAAEARANIARLKDVGFTGVDIARRVELDEATVSRLGKGEEKPTSLLTLREVIQALRKFVAEAVHAQFSRLAPWRSGMLSVEAWCASPETHVNATATMQTVHGNVCGALTSQGIALEPLPDGVAGVILEFKNVTRGRLSVIQIHGEDDYEQLVHTAHELEDHAKLLRRRAAELRPPGSRLGRPKPQSRF